MDEKAPYQTLSGRGIAVAVVEKIATSRTKVDCIASLELRRKRSGLKSGSVLETQLVMYLHFILILKKDRSSVMAATDVMPCLVSLVRS